MSVHPAELAAIGQIVREERDALAKRITQTDAQVTDRLAEYEQSLRSLTEVLTTYARETQGSFREASQETLDRIEKVAGDFRVQFAETASSILSLTDGQERLSEDIRGQLERIEDLDGVCIDLRESFGQIQAKNIQELLRLDNRINQIAALHGIVQILTKKSDEYGAQLKDLPPAVLRLGKVVADLSRQEAEIAKLRDDVVDVDTRRVADLAAITAEREQLAADIEQTLQDLQERQEKLIVEQGDQFRGFADAANLELEALQQSRRSLSEQLTEQYEGLQEQQCAAIAALDDALAGAQEQQHARLTEHEERFQEFVGTTGTALGGLHDAQGTLVERLNEQHEISQEQQRTAAAALDEGLTEVREQHRTQLTEHEERFQEFVGTTDTALGGLHDAQGVLIERLDEQQQAFDDHKETSAEALAHIRDTLPVLDCWLDDGQTKPQNQVLSHRGGIWQSRVSTQEEPGAGVDWDLLVDGIYGIAQERVDHASLEFILERASGTRDRFRVVIPTPNQLGTWKAENVPYKRDDVVTDKGHRWIALEDNPQGRPSDPESTDWKMYAMRGARGRKGDRGEPGRDGLVPPIEEVVKQWREYLDGDDAVAINRYRGAWAYNEYFARGDVVSVGRGLYLSTADGTSEVPPGPVDEGRWLMLVDPLAFGGGGGGAGSGDAVSWRGVDLAATFQTPGDGFIPVYRSGSGEWILEAKPISGANPSMGDISDTNFTSLTDLDQLTYVTGQWVNRSFASMDILTGTEIAAAYEPLDPTIIREADVDDIPVNGAALVPVSSNWAFDHALTDSGVHGVAGTLVGTTDTQTLTSKTIDASLNTVLGIGYAEVVPALIDDAPVRVFSPGDFLLFKDQATGTLGRVSYDDLPGAGGSTDALSWRAVPLATSFGTPGDGVIPVYRVASGEWVLEAKPAAGSNPAMADITDTQFAGLENDDLLAYENGLWVNKSVIDLGTPVLNQAVLRDGSNALTANWDAGSFDIRAQAFQSDVVTGTAPLIVQSTTLVGNLNADLLDGQEGSYYLDISNATGILPLANGGLGAATAAGGRATLELGTAAVRDVGNTSITVAAGDAPANAVSAHVSSFDHTNIPTTPQKAALDANLALGAANPVAAQDDLPSIGTGIGDVIQLEDVGGGTPGLPAVDGSQLTNLATVGEANNGVNLGGGQEWFKGKVGTDLQFRTTGNTATITWAQSGDLLQANVATGVFEPAFAKATAFNLNFGTSPGTVAAGDHLHIGVYATAAQGVRADSALQPDDIGVSIGDLVVLEDVGGNPGFPAVDGSQLLNLPGGANNRTGVTATDTTPGFLASKLFSGDASVSFTVTNPGGDESLDIRATGAGGGEVNDGENLGLGPEWFIGKNGVNLQFRTPENTATVTWAQVGNNLEASVPGGIFEPAFDKNTAFNKDFGISAGTVALGDHLHTGVYATAAQGSLADSALQPSDIGTSVGDVVGLEDVGGSPGLPAVDGSQLLNLPGGGGPIEHGDLIGLGDDDHLQYHTDARGDARYYTQGQVDTEITGAKARSNHTGTQVLATISDAGSAAGLNAGVLIGDVVQLENVGGNPGLPAVDGSQLTNLPGGGVSDHGGLTGLGDDDHLQYHTDARGDARYYTQAQVDTEITGAKDRANHTGTQTLATISDAGNSAGLDVGTGSGTVAAGDHTHPGLGDIFLATIGGNIQPAFVDTGRGSKTLTANTVNFLWMEAALSDNDWLEIGRAVDALTGHVMLFNATIVGATFHCENDNGNQKEINLYIDGALNSTLFTATGAGENLQTETALNIDVAAGSKLRLRAGTAGGNILDTVVTLYVKWRL